MTYFYHIEKPFCFYFNKLIYHAWSAIRTLHNRLYIHLRFAAKRQTLYCIGLARPNFWLHDQLKSLGTTQASLYRACSNKWKTRNCRLFKKLYFRFINDINNATWLSVHSLQCPLPKCGFAGRLVQETLQSWYTCNAKIVASRMKRMNTMYMHISLDPYSFLLQYCLIKSSLFLFRLKKEKIKPHRFLFYLNFLNLFLAIYSF